MKILRGMKDILEQSDEFLHLIKTASKLAQNFGHKFIQTPILEETSLYLRSVGDSSDIVNKEMYSFTDKGNNNVSLRPEGTAGVVRSYIEHNFSKGVKQQKFFYYGPMFRYERPQKGRFRQFNQFGVESFGVESVLEDVNIIALASCILKDLNISATLEINSLGCKTCMPSYKEKLVEFLNSCPNLCETCQMRKQTNPIRVMDCKNPACKNALKNAPKITDCLCDTCKRDFESLKEHLSLLNISFVVNKDLVRGLDYYNKTAFEFVSNALGSQNAVIGGGRYDFLTQTLGADYTPAVGFAIGIERILDLVTLPSAKLKGVYFGALDEQFLAPLFKAYSLIIGKKLCHFEPSVKSLKNHLKLADKKQLRYCVIIGENEASKDCVWVKDLLEKKEKLVNISKLENELE